MKKNIVITVKGIGKKYFIGERQMYLTLRELLTSIPQKIFGAKTSSKDQSFWALKNISFKVGSGDVVGIIGRNGAGKSTLLKILSQITEPTTGSVKLKGRVASLLEVGTGFNPELTGRENIFQSGAILGMTHEEIQGKMSSIVKFSGVEKFIDTPVKRYSSGMYVRLAFSVAAHLDSDILLIDEVLAVGDASFQKKCLGKMKDLAHSGRTVIFVSHNILAISRLCSKVIYLKDGKIEKFGDTDEVISMYHQSIHNPKSIGISDVKIRSGQGDVEFTDFSIRNKSGSKISKLVPGKPVVFQMSYKSNKKSKNIKNPKFSVKFFTQMGQFISRIDSLEVENKFSSLPSIGTVRCTIDRFPFMNGDYYMEIALRVDGVIEDIFEIPGNLLVTTGNYYGNKEIVMTSKQQGVFMDQSWEEVSMK